MLKIFILIVIFVVSSCQIVFAYSSNDYFRAGVQLYSTKNYNQAIQYFDAALQLNTNNTDAMQMRGNCYYLLGQYQQALEDYQKILTINPSDTQMSDFVKKLKEKLGSSGSNSETTLDVNSNENFTQGLNFYNNKQYAQAELCFERATHQDSKNARIYYYLGASQLMLNDRKEAALNLSLSNELASNPTLAAYVQKLKATLSPDDRQWVNANLSGGTGQDSISSDDEEDSKIIGLRLEPAIALVNLGDFSTDANTRLTLGQDEQEAGDSSYQFTSQVPSSYPDMTIEPTLKILPFLELGLPFTYMPVGSYTFAAKDNYGFSDTGFYSISALGIGINVRVFYGDGPVKLFAATGPLMVPVNLTYSESHVNSEAGTYTETAATSSVAFGGQFQLGADYHLGGGLLLSAYIGYRTVTATDLTGTATVVENGSTFSGSGEFYSVPTQYGNFIDFISPSSLSSLPTNSRPLNVDLSSILSGVQLSLYF